MGAHTVQFPIDSTTLFAGNDLHRKYRLYYRKKCNCRGSSLELLTDENELCD